MKTLDRYIALVFIKNLLISITALTALFLFQALLGELLDHEYTTSQVLIYNALNIPQIIIQMTPPSVLVATVLTLSGFNRTNELVACFAIGIGLKRLSGVIISIVVLVSCWMLVMQDRILPAFFRKRTVYYYREMKKQNDFFLDIKQNKIWYRSKNLIYNLRTFDPKSKTIYGMSVYTFDKKFNLVQVIDAEKALYTPEGWKLLNGNVILFQKDDPFPLSNRFKEKNLQIQETPTEFQEIEKEVEGLRLKELNQYIKKSKAAGSDTKNYEVKFHSKLSLSIIPIIMCFLGIPFSVRNKREGSLAKDLGLCLGMTFFYWLFYSVGLSLGSNGALAPWLAAWLPSAIFGFIVVVLITRTKL